MGDSNAVSPRTLEVIFLAAMALAVLVGGRALLVQIATYKGLAIAVLGVVAMVILYAFRRDFRRDRPGARLQAARDAAFLAAIAAAIAFVAAPARWSLGAAVVGLEVGLVVELLARLGPERTA